MELSMKFCVITNYFIWFDRNFFQPNIIICAPIEIKNTLLPKSIQRVYFFDEF